MSGNRRLNDDGRLRRIDSGGNKKSGRFPDFGRQFIRALVNRYGVQINNAKNAFVSILDFRPIFDGAQIISNVKLAAGLYAR